MAQEVKDMVTMINDPNVDLIDKAKVYAAYVPSRAEIMTKMRPWMGEFCPDVASFGLPTSPSHLWQRLSQNLISFHMNYAVLASIVLAYSLIASQPFVVVCIGVILACSYIAFQYAEARLRGYLSYTSVKWTVVGVLLLTTIYILYTLATFLTFFVVAIIFGHAALRDEKLVNKDGVNVENNTATDKIELLDGDNVQRRPGTQV